MSRGNIEARLKSAGIENYIIDREREVIVIFYHSRPEDAEKLINKCNNCIRADKERNRCREFYEPWRMWQYSRNGRCYGYHPRWKGEA